MTKSKMTSAATLEASERRKSLLGKKEFSLVEWGAGLSGQQQQKCLVIGSSIAPTELIRCLQEIQNETFPNAQTEFVARDLWRPIQLLGQSSKFFDRAPLMMLGTNERGLVLEFSSSFEKTIVLKAVEEFLGATVRPTILENTLAIVDEMAMNAIYDAPKEAQKRGLPFDLYKQGRKTRLFVQQNDERVLVTCVDPFGSLNVESLLRRLESVSEKGAGASINMGEGGAGIGCFIILERCSSMCVAVDPECMTVFSCTIPSKLRQKDLLGLKKKLYLAVNSNDGTRGRNSHGKTRY
jgi:hypothetical protein